MIDSAEHDFLSTLRTHCHDLEQLAATAAHHVETRIFNVLGDSSTREGTMRTSPGEDSPTLTIHDVRLMIEKELEKSSLGTDPPLIISAALSLKVTTDVTTDAGITVSVCGIGGGVGAGRSSANTRRVTLSFTTGTEMGQAGHFRVLGRSGKDLAEELRALKQILPSNDKHWNKAEIDVDFTLASQANANLVVSAKFQESSTHTLQLMLTKPG